MHPQTADAPYGAWPSQISATDLAAGSLRLAEVATWGPHTYWLESRPEDGKAILIHRHPDGSMAPVGPPGNHGSPAAIPVRTRVNEYGGGSYAITGDGVVLSADGDDRLYHLQRTGTDWSRPRALVPDDGRRYADLEVDTARGLVYAVAEDHGGSGEFRTDPTTTLVAVPLDGSAAEDADAVATLAADADFVAAPRLSPDGAELAWVSWWHPDMPWDASVLTVATITDGGTRLLHHRRIAGGAQTSVAEPVWTPGGDLVHVDDRTGWWNLYRTQFDEPMLRTRHLHPAEADFTTPQWSLGNRRLRVLDEDHLMSSFTTAGRQRLAAVQIGHGGLEVWDGQWRPEGSLAAESDRVVFIGRTDHDPTAVVELDLTAGTVAVLRSSAAHVLDHAHTAVAEDVSWPSEAGLAHGFFYPPVNPDVPEPHEQLPPLLVLSHGGPTANVTAGFDPAIQFWTTRGFAVLDVNYSGSSGYGRHYRDRLYGNWGVLDVADCAAGARHLAEQGRVDGARMAVRGGSAGGFTTLAALTFTDVFAAGASYYGIGDLEALAQQTHKFESRYLERLVGPYPQQRQMYRDRSPIHHLGRLSAPMIIFQGEQDRVVPPAQAREMAHALRRAGHEVQVHMFADEGHGFRKAANVAQALRAELAFYGEVFGFTPA